MMTVTGKVAQWWPALCDPMDYTVHGILRARILAAYLFKVVDKASCLIPTNVKISNPFGHFLQATS